MRRFRDIIESPFPVPTNVLWLKGSTLKGFVNGKWTTLGGVDKVAWNDITDKPVVSKNANGLMSVALLQKLNGIEAQANKYTLPAASASLGGVKIASSVADTDATEAATAQTVATTLNELLAALRASGVLTA